jgi:hypothetical protein
MDFEKFQWLLFPAEPGLSPRDLNELAVAAVGAPFVTEDRANRREPHRHNRWGLGLVERIDA